jgi:Acyltransferase family
MTVVTSQATEGVKARPASGMRNLAYDRARSFIILLVLIHHSVIPYTYFGHTDRQSFLGFDAVVTFNDSFFMAAMFLLSGLFVWPSLERKGIGSFLRGRLLRLGLPFAIGAVILMPLAYYAIDLREHRSSFDEFWWKMVTVGPWPSGPIWFIAVLLGFDMLAAAIYRLAPSFVEAVGRLSLASLKRPADAFWALLALSIITYVPLDLYFGIGRWLTLGPLAIQASRILLYLLYFFVGVGIGAVGSDRGLLSRESALARHWAVWLAAATLAYVSILVLLYYKHEHLPDPNNPPLWWNAAHALAFACFSATQTFNLLVLFLRFDSRGSSLLDPLRDTSYGIFLIHYVPLLWLQYALFNDTLVPNTQETAILKAGIVFALTLATSWAATVALRRIPGVRHVL